MCKLTAAVVILPSFIFSQDVKQEYVFLFIRPGGRRL